jgi:hypothetical protein
MPGKTTATIDRERRDALYELVLDHLSGIGDFWIAIEEKDFVKAERLGSDGSRFARRWRSTLRRCAAWLNERKSSLVATTILRLWR